MKILIALTLAVSAMSCATKDHADVAKTAQDADYESLIELSGPQSKREGLTQYYGLIARFLSRSVKAEEISAKCSLVEGSQAKLVLVVKANGKISSIAIKKKGSKSRCYKKYLAVLDFPLPPESPFYLKLDMP